MKKAGKTSPLKAEAAPLSFEYTPSQIQDRCKAEIKTLESRLDAVGKVDPKKATKENALLALETALTEFGNAISPMIFIKDISTDAKAREAAKECDATVQQMFVEIYTREDLFRPLKALEGTKLSTDEKRLLDEYLVSFKRSGLELKGDKRKQFIEKKKKLVLLESEFSKNLAEWKDALIVTEKEMDGLTPDYIAGLEKQKDGKYRISLDYPRYFGFMENAKDENARKRLEEKFFKRGGDRNRELLEEAIQIRHQLAQLLGYPNHAAFVLERRMAKNPEAVESFLKTLSARLKPVGRENIDTLLAIKRDYLKNPKADRVNSWDWRFYDNVLKKSKYDLDNQKLKEYFPLQKVLAGMFDIYQTILGVQFSEVKDAPRWHDSAQLFKVKRGTKTVAYFYMDLFPRDGKYSHAAAFTLTSGYQRADGEYQKPVSAIVANFNPPAAGNPSLLEHSEVETLFHEFGHIMHQVLTTAKYASFSGTNVKTDFVEAPSQMLENWVWEKKPLAKISGHYKTGKPLPTKMLEKLIKAKLVNAGIKYLRQVSYASLDFTYHTSPKVDSTAVYKKIIEDTMMIPVQDGTIPQASFGHLMGGYDSGYYGYLWSEVFAADMYSRFEKEGIFNKKAGADYVKWILQPGGMKDPTTLIESFLGRASNEKAFLKSIGVKTTPDVAKSKKKEK